MKLLLFYAHKWWFKTASKGLPQVPDIEREDSANNSERFRLRHSESSGLYDFNTL
jgi:hypothetical protein